MESTGIIKPVDLMGRVGIPKYIREQLKIEDGVDKMEVFTEGDLVVLRKYEPKCTLCGNLGASLDFNGRTICYECIENLNKMKNGE